MYVYYRDRWVECKRSHLSQKWNAVRNLLLHGSMNQLPGKTVQKQSYYKILSCACRSIPQMKKRIKWARMSYMETKIVRNVRDEPDASSTEQRGNHDDSVRTNVWMWTNMIRIISSSVYRRVRFHDKKSCTECYLNCSIVTVISLIIERLRRVWWRDKRYVKFYFLRKLSKQWTG